MLKAKMARNKELGLPGYLFFLIQCILKVLMKIMTINLNNSNNNSKYICSNKFKKIRLKNKIIEKCLIQIFKQILLIKKYII